MNGLLDFKILTLNLQWCTSRHEGPLRIEILLQQLGCNLTCTHDAQFFFVFWGKVRDWMLNFSMFSDDSKRSPTKFPYRVPKVPKCVPQDHLQFPFHDFTWLKMNLPTLHLKNIQNYAFINTWMWMRSFTFTQRKNVNKFTSYNYKVDMSKSIYICMHNMLWKGDTLG
jgi:hypothetical protein